MFHLQFLNVFFHIAHILVISFILIGWAFEKTRPLHFITMLLTIFSWIGLGYFYGWGYCFLTDWHWQVRDLLGLPYPASYIKLLADSLAGRSWDGATIDTITALFFFFVLGITVFVNFRRANRSPV